MTGYDHYVEAERIAAKLDDVKLNEMATRVRDAISSGFTSSEILMRLRQALAPVRGHSRLSTAAAAEVETLWDKLEEALRK